MEKVISTQATLIEAIILSPEKQMDNKRHQQQRQQVEDHSLPNLVLQWQQSIPRHHQEAALLQQTVDNLKKL